MLDLSFYRGLLAGKHYALALLKPASMTPRPVNPYWCPLRRICYAAGFSIGAHRVLYPRT